MLLAAPAIIGAGKARAQFSQFVGGVNPFNITGNANSPGGNGVVVTNWNPNTQLTHWIAAMSAAAYGTPSQPARITCLGDSTTQGTGAAFGSAYPDYLVTALGLASGIKTTQANWAGDQLFFSTVTFTGSAAWNFGLVGVGFAMATTSTAGDTITVAPPGGSSPFAGTFDQLDVYLFDGQGQLSVTITGGPSSPHTATLAAGGNTGNVVKQTITLPSGTYSSATQLVFTQVGSPVCFLSGFSLWLSTKPGIQIYNQGVSGEESSFVDQSVVTGANILAGTNAIGASLALINFGINDYNNDNVSLTTVESNLTQCVSTLRSINCDPILIMPQPLPTASPVMFTYAQLQTAYASLANTLNCPCIDLCGTYGSVGNSQQAAFWTFWGGTPPHPPAPAYQDFAERYASILTNTPQTYPNSVGYPVAPIGPLD